MSATPAGPGPAGSRGRILLVEDDPEAALFAVHVLAKRGRFEVTHTADPAVALLPVAVITAHAHLRAAALLRRADEFLTKPLGVDQLLATATALIGRATSQ